VVSLLKVYEEMVRLLSTPEDDLSEAEGKKLEQIRTVVVPKLKAGVPFEKRGWQDPKAVVNSNKWLTGTVSRKPIACNGEMLFVGKPRSPMFAEQAPSDTRQRLPQTVASCLKGRFQPVQPHTYQIEELGLVELVWMANAKQEFFVAIQAKYHDFLIDRFPKLSWFAKSQYDSVQARVQNRGLKDNVVAIVMPYIVKEPIKPPAPRKGWLDVGKSSEVPGQEGEEV
jgi:hypothetical protein